MSIIERITQIIDTEHLNQSELCKVLGIKDSTFSTWKTRGTDPPAKYILLICEFLNVSVDYLLGRTDSPNGYYNTQVNSNNSNSYVIGDNNNNTGNDVNNNSSNGLDKNMQEIVDSMKDFSILEQAEIITKINEIKNRR